jgi:hypothetical protein
VQVNQPCIVIRLSARNGFAQRDNSIADQPTVAEM